MGGLCNLPAIAGDDRARDPDMADGGGEIGDRHAPPARQQLAGGEIDPHALIGELDLLGEAEMREERMVADDPLDALLLGGGHDRGHLLVRDVSQVEDDVGVRHHPEHLVELRHQRAVGVEQVEAPLVAGELGNAALDGEAAAVLPDRAGDYRVIGRVDGRQPDLPRLVFDDRLDRTRIDAADLQVAGDAPEDVDVRHHFAGQQRHRRCRKIVGLEADRAHAGRLGVLSELDRVLDARIEIGTVMDVDIDRPLQELKVAAWRQLRHLDLAWQDRRQRPDQSKTAVASTSISMSGCIRPATPTAVTQGERPVLECFRMNSVRAGSASRHHFSRSTK